MTIILHGTNGVTTAGITLGSTAIASTGAELNILDGVTSTAAELNILDGVTSTTAELNILDGVTSTTAELNILDGVTSTAAELNILDGVTSTAAELNIMDGVTTTAAEINLIDGGTARGTTALADGDGILINDAGTMRMSTVQTVKTYMTAGVGASTTYGAVGTYVLGRRTHQTNNQVEFIPGNTYAGSSLYPGGISASAAASTGAYGTNVIYNGDINSRITALSGTWRAMGENNHDDTFNPMTLFVRTA